MGVGWLLGFVAGVDDSGRLMVLGGNQGNRVSIAPFDKARVIGYRWPMDVPASEFCSKLPLLASSAPASANEA